MNPFTKSDLVEFFNILHIDHEEITGQLDLGTTEKTLLSNDDKSDLITRFCFIGTDGTTGLVSEDDPDAPTLIAASSIGWGIENDQTRVHEASNRIVLQGEDRESNSGFRTMLELKQGVCLAIAMKQGSFDCAGCLFANSGCTWQRSNLKPWEWFPGKEPVVIVDLPVEFKFVNRLPLESKTRKFFEGHLKQVFGAIRDKNVAVLLVTHRAKIQNVSREFTSQIDDAIGSLDERAKALVDLIASKGEQFNHTLKTLTDFFDWTRDKYFTDYDLLADWMDTIGKPSPVFLVAPSELNNMWGAMKYHYLTWGYRESIDGSCYYGQNCWVRIGYSPAIDPVTAHKVALLEMILGKGHSIALTLAHQQCNMFKHNHLELLRQYLNKIRPAKHHIGFNVKTTNKWRLSRS